MTQPSRPLFGVSQFTTWHQTFEEGGQTLVALWLPMTLEQKEAQIKKAMKEGTTVSRLVLEFLDKWMKNKK
jgi:hypothetical protein